MTSESQERPAEGRTGSGSGASMTSAEGIAHGITIATSIVVLLWLGDQLDGRLGTSPLFALLGMVFGAGSSFYRMYLHLVILPREQEAAREEKETE